MNKYPKVRRQGHRDIANLLVGTFVVQEKVDGSNFSFGKGEDGRLFCWSRTQELSLTSPDGMFIPAVEHVKKISDKLPYGTIFRCEYLRTPKHNVLTYSHIPANHLALFQIDNIHPGIQPVVCPSILNDFAGRYDIAAVPEYFMGCLEDLPYSFDECVRSWHKQESFLGGSIIEGVVIKNFNHTDERTGAPYLIGKVVREEFKEAHTHQIKFGKPDPVQMIGAKCGGPARWHKAVQALEERGELTASMEDIPKLMRYVQLDVATEEEDDIKEALWKLYRKNVVGAAARGLPEWYKNLLAGLPND